MFPNNNMNLNIIISIIMSIVYTKRLCSLLRDKEPLCLKYGLVWDPRPTPVVQLGRVKDRRTQFDWMETQILNWLRPTC